MATTDTPAQLRPKYSEVRIASTNYNGQLIEKLNALVGSNQRVAERIPSNADLRLHSNAKIMLGVDGQKRFNSFCDEKAGWNFGEGEPLSTTATNHFNLFCSLVEESLVETLQTKVSLFMGNEGSLEISWRNGASQLFNIEFFDDRIEYYFEVSGAEGTINPNEIRAFVRETMKLHA